MVSENVDGELDIRHLALWMSVDQMSHVKSPNGRTHQFCVTCFSLSAQLQPAVCVCSLGAEAGMEPILESYTHLRDSPSPILGKAISTFSVFEKKKLVE